MRDRVLSEDEAVAINPGMMRDEFVGFTGQLAYFGERYSLAVAKAAACSEQLKDAEAEVYLELRAKGGTEAELKAKVRLDRRVQLARTLSVQADADEHRFKHKVMDPLYAKRDMLISIGAHQRAELAGDPIVRHARREDVASLEERAFGPEGGALRGR